MQLERRLGVFTATTLIVGSMIGSGIFIAPSIMAGFIATPGVFLGLWVIGGLLTLLGALAYAELAAMLPQAGGQYVYLREAFGPRWAFLYGWTVFVVIQTGFNAAVAIAFSKFLGGLGLSLGEKDLVLQLGAFTLSRAQLVAVGVIALLTVINARGVREGAWVQDLFTIAKVAAVVMLVVLGFSSSKGSFSNFWPVFGTALGNEGLKLGFLAAAGVAMSKALFAYDAWNTVTFAAGEIKEPQKNLPRALVAGTLITTLLYVLACAAYLYVLPIGEMAGVKENRVAAQVAQVIMGAPGVLLVSLAILVSTFGCLNGLILGGARVFYAMSQDRLFFKAAGRVDPVRGTPSGALLLQGIWSAVLALSGTYSALLTYVTFASLAFNALTVVGLFVLRSKQPALERPYRTWGYPVTPAIYLIGSVFFLIYIVIGDPRSSLAGVGLVLLGIPAYAYFSRRSAPTSARS